MTPLQRFASAIAKARSGFDSGGPWIAFYEAKQTATAFESTFATTARFTLIRESPVGVAPLRMAARVPISKR